MTSKELALEIVKVLDEKKALDIKVIEINELTIIADYFVIASGTSSTHTKALAEDVDFKLGKQGVIPSARKGAPRMDTDGLRRGAGACVPKRDAGVLQPRTPLVGRGGFGPFGDC
jgi:ribosome silencing factor RsfS/YbeB/iojap